MDAEGPAGLITESSVPSDAARVRVKLSLATGNKPTHEAPSPGITPHRFAALFVSQIEDALLTVGGLVAGISANFAPATIGLVVGGLVLAGVGKSLPSLVGQAFKLSPGPFPKGKSTDSGWKPSGAERDYNALVGDILLLCLTVTAAGIYLHTPSARALFLALVGAGLVIKAGLELVEEGRLAVALDRQPKSQRTTTAPSGRSESDGAPSLASTLQSATTEGTVLLAFGLVAIVLCWVRPTGLTADAATALALAAVGKALPSFVSAGSGGSGK